MVLTASGRLRLKPTIYKTVSWFWTSHNALLFEANMVVPLYAVIAKLVRSSNQVKVQNISSAVEDILQRNQFLTIFNHIVVEDTKQTTLPFKIFEPQAGIQFYDYLNSHMKGKGMPTMTARLIKCFRLSLLEIFQNANIHAKSDSGIFVCGQYFPNMNRLDFSVADAGIGIRDNVIAYTGQRNMDSCGAIRWALTEGNTTQTTDHPGGLGLKLIKSFIRLNKGKFQIISRFGYYQFTAEGENFREMGNDFPGTCVNIEINTRDTNFYKLSSE